MMRTCSAYRSISMAKSRAFASFFVAFTLDSDSRSSSSGSRPDRRLAKAQTLFGTRQKRRLQRPRERRALNFACSLAKGRSMAPKLEFILKDQDGREWQCGTIQLDFVPPER